MTDDRGTDGDEKDPVTSGAGWKDGSIGRRSFVVAETTAATPAVGATGASAGTAQAVIPFDTVLAGEAVDGDVGAALGRGAV